MNRKRQGFSLIELLVVVAIILIIAAIAIPNLLRAKGAANQASAVGSLRAINTAQQVYQNTYTTFSLTLADLGGSAGTSAAANLLDPILSGVFPSTTTPVKSGYEFIMTSDATGAAYNVIAFPTTGAPSGLNSYCTDQTGAIYYLASPATGFNTALAADALCSATAAAQPI